MSQSRQQYEGSRYDSSERMPTFSRFNFPPDPSFESLLEGIASLDVLQIQEPHEKRGRLSPWNQAAEVALRLDVGWVATETIKDPVEWYRDSIARLDIDTLIYMFASNPANLEIPVTWWPFNDEISEHFDAEDLNQMIGAKTRDRVLIVTEGKSDTNVLKKALNLLRPEFEDFFTFVDMSENYPFTGVGNLSNFYKGLRKIGMQNNVIVLFDNDAEGSAKYGEVAELPEMSNIKPLRLPDLADLEKFPTIGPTGEHEANVNGRASSIECFLDLGWGNHPAPAIRWTSYNKQIDRYQGELINKDVYVKDFLNITQSDLVSYDTTKLGVLLDHIFRTMEIVNQQQLLKGYDSIW